MKFSHILLVVATAVFGAGCSSIENSRDLANPKVSATTLAQQVCSLCHGIDGDSSNPSFPNLAAQQPTYFMAQLKAFRAHDRLDPEGVDQMWGLSRSLTDEQIKGLADYFSAKTSAPVSGATADAVAIAAGKGIFEEGIPAKGVTACSACHGPQAQGNEDSPRLAHQHANYIIKQLTVFKRTEERPEGAIMKTAVQELTDKNMEDVAAYLEEIPAQ